MGIETEPQGSGEGVNEAVADAATPEIPVHTSNLIEARDHLVETGQSARNWAVENPEHPVSYLLTRTDIGEETKIQSLRRIESVALPDEVNELLDAARNFNECKAAAQAEFEAEQHASESGLVAVGNRDIFEGLRSAYLNLLRGYRNWGGFGYHGWTEKKDPDSYYGPAIWSRQDCVFRFGKALEREFPERVHLDLKISKATTGTFDSTVDRRQTVDIAVTIPGLYSREMSQRRFKGLRHDLFVEVEWLKKGRWLNADQLVKRCANVQQDLIDLQRSIDRGRCEFAAMVIVDDEGFLDFHGDLLKWPPDVIPLIISPGAIQEHHLGNGSIEPILEEIGELHDAHCPCADRTFSLQL